MEAASLWAWGGFTVFVLGMLALDLGVFHRHAHEVRMKEAVAWSAVWIGMALLFNLWVWHSHGREAGLEFLTGYLIEKSLSVDNIFVFLMLFSAFAVPAVYQHKILFWGILGALVMRAVLIAAGAVLISRFHWVVYPFGLFLVWSAWKMLNAPAQPSFDPESSALVRGFRRLFPMTDGYRGAAFLVREGGVLKATPLLLVLLIVEVTDLAFAVDSIPAIFAVTEDPYIVYTSNIFAILGLRALYFALAGFVARLRYLKTGLAGVLAFVGVKILVSGFYKVPVSWSLLAIAAILGAAVWASLRPRKDSLPAPGN